MLFKMDWMLSVSVVVFSLLIGSFLAMLSYRLPLILKNQWQNRQLTKHFNIFLPFSHCSNCKHSLNFLEKLPLLAYFYLKGKCAYCGKKIHFRYLLIEVVTLLCSSIVVYRFNWGIQMLAALILTWGLIVLSGIDFEHSLLPDVLVLPLLWLGLGLNAFHVFVSPKSAILGSSIAYLSLWILAKSYQGLTKKEGMGHGDFKFFGLLGAWLGVHVLVDILLMASLLGSVVGCLLVLKRKNSFQKPIPFGPYLAIAGYFTLLNYQLLA